MLILVGVNFMASLVFITVIMLTKSLNSLFSGWILTMVPIGLKFLCQLKIEFVFVKRK